MKRAIVLYNLGGPDNLDAVEPFLFNLFNDRAIIGLPQPFRALLARVISKRRGPIARDIYAKLGGASPILPGTEAQRAALEAALGVGGETKLFIAMRYWHPTVKDAARAVKAFDPDEVLLLPLYPQFSTTTTGSFTTAWAAASKAAGLAAPVKSLCCYPLAVDFIRAHVTLLREALAQAGGVQGQRVLFSAHGLPKRIVERGDPYQWQVERTAEAIVSALEEPELDWRITYQSRVGPLEWIGPATDREIIEAAAAGLGLIIVPIAFVSEHSETLVELDIEYRHLAEKAGAKSYIRVPTLGTHESYISALAQLVRDLSERAGPIHSQDSVRLCPTGFRSCPNTLLERAR